MQRLGLVGLANAGKSSLFSALTGIVVPVAPHPFSTTESSTGAALLPDARLDALAAMSASRKVVRASVELMDIAGLVAGSSTGEGMGNRFLAGVREMDALVMVLRAFQDPSVPGAHDPVEALEALELELVMADVSSLEAQVERRRRQARLKGDRATADQTDAAVAALEHLQGGVPVYRAGLPTDVRAQLHNFFLLTDKPVLAVVNLGEDQVDSASELTRPVASALEGVGEVLGVSVKLEAEAAELPVHDRGDLLEGLGLGEGVLPRVARASFELLGLRTFFTTGDKESRAWTFHAGAHAPACAGVIHSDLERGFIRAEVIHWDELVEIGSWAQAKAAGRLRVEGKDYEVLDGDVLEIRFNV